MPQPMLSVIILTLNEEANLPVALASLRGLDVEVFVVDSGSTDRTLEIARAAGCKVVQHPFESQAHQLNWALDNLPIATPWVMRLDADERLTPELAEELAARLPALPDDVSGLALRCRVYFWGRWIRHGSYYPLWVLRIWRHGRARCEDRHMDEHMVVNAGRAARLQHDIIDENRKGLTFWTQKHNGYADREAKEFLSIERGSRSSNGPATDQARRRRWLKENLYGRAPLFWRAFGYWFYRYVLRLGFLDGRPGLVFHFLQGFWYRFLVDAKLVELERARSHLLESQARPTSPDHRPLSALARRQ